jgi:hypothetical protein
VVVVVADIAFVGEVPVDSIVLVVVLVGILRTALVVGRLVEEGLEDNPVVRRSILGST